MKKYIAKQIADLTNHGNIKALLDPPKANQKKPVSTAASRAIREASTKLTDPFEIAPGSRPLPATGRPDRVGSPAALQAL